MSRRIIETLLRKLTGFCRGKRRIPLPLLGTVRAGFGLPPREALLGGLSLDEYLVRRPEASFLLKVSGDSMNGEGILPGDLVIVERGREAKTGDVVVAQVDGEWTMKYFTRAKNGAVRLESANPKYPPLEARKEMTIAGVVRAVVRKYHL